MKTLHILQRCIREHRLLKLVTLQAQDVSVMSWLRKNGQMVESCLDSTTLISCAVVHSSLMPSCLSTIGKFTGKIVF